MNDDGTMSRLEDLVPFARRHGLKIGTIADLIKYRRRHDSIVRVVGEKTINSAFGGEFRMKVYANTAEPAEHIALIKGDISSDGSSGGPTLVRMHHCNIFDDLLGAGGRRRSDAQRAMEIIGREGRGVVVLIRDTACRALSDEMKEEMSGEGPQKSAGDESGGRRLVEYGVGAQILLDLGVREIELLSDHSMPHPVGLEGFGLTISKIRPLSEGQISKGKGNAD